MSENFSFEPPFVTKKTKGLPRRIVLDITNEDSEMWRWIYARVAHLNIPTPKYVCHILNHLTKAVRQE